MVIDDVMRLEATVRQALVDGDAETDGRLLSDDFLGVYPTGFAGRSDHIDQLGGGPTVAAFTLSDERLMELSDSVVMLSYRAEFRRVDRPPNSEPDVMYVSSLWCLRDDGWINVFSQDTPAGDAVP